MEAFVFYQNLGNPPCIAPLIYAALQKVIVSTPVSRRIVSHIAANGHGTLLRCETCCSHSGTASTTTRRNGIRFYFSVALPPGTYRVHTYTSVVGARPRYRRTRLYPPTTAVNIDNCAPVNVFRRPEKDVRTSRTGCTRRFLRPRSRTNCMLSH